MKQLKQTNAEQLETETRKMEERIRSLKEQMVREKEEREWVAVIYNQDLVLNFSHYKSP